MSDSPSRPTALAESEALRDRKAEHIRLALSERMQEPARAFDHYCFEHEALPELDLAAIETTTRFLGRDLETPLLISCMTGGTELAATINRHLAIGAEETGVALGVGSQRKAIEDPSQVATFEVRRYAPSVPLLANLGAVQLNYGFGIDECRRAVEMIDADALVLHLNPLQEAIQPEGQTDFRRLLDQIGEIVDRLEVPVVVKEVGSGISRRTGEALRRRGVRFIDTAGVGGTSWARIEASRSGDLELGELFADWGITTPESIAALATVEGLTVIGSGGIRTGIEVAKAIALGASLAGLAYPFLQAAMDSPEAVVATVGRLRRELLVTMFCVGAGDLGALGRVELARRPW